MNAKRASKTTTSIVEGKHLPLVLKSATCKSLSGRSTLGYEIGATPDKELHVRVRSNSGSGSFGLDWVPLRALQQALAKAPLPITCTSLHRVFAGKSANTSGFIVAALFHEGLLKPLGDTRGYEPTDGAEFMREVKRLLDKGPYVAESTPTKADTAKAPAKKADTAQAPAKKADQAMPSPRKAGATAKAKAGKM